MATDEIPKVKYEEIPRRLAEVLAKWPLYRAFVYSYEEYNQSNLPDQIQHYCKSCKAEQRWSLLQRDQRTYYYGFCTVEYLCRNCREANLHYYYIWNQNETTKTSGFIKIGQHPPLEERIPTQLEARLEAKGSEDLDYYKKALRCRNFNFGLAALSYLRRVIENRMNDMLDLIADLAREYHFATDEIAELEHIKASRVFDNKVTFASKILPPSLRPSGENPVDLLHDIASEGIHHKSEDECIELFDTSRHVFEYLFRELEVRKADADQYVAGLKELLTKKAARRSRQEQGES